MDLTKLDDFSEIENLLRGSKPPIPSIFKKENVGETVTIPESCCPFCEAKVNTSVTALGPHKPGHKDVSICVNCAEVLVFDEDMKLRKPDFDDWMRIQEDPNIEKQIETAQAYMRKLKK